MKDESIFKEIAKQLEIQNAYASFDVATLNKKRMDDIDKSELRKKLKYIDEKYSGNYNLMKTTIDSYDDLKRVMVTGVSKSAVRREEMLRNVIEFIFKQIDNGEMYEQNGYEYLETVANNSKPPIQYDYIKALWNEYAEESNMKLKE